MVNAESIVNRLAGEWRVSMKFSMEGGSTAKGRGTAVGRSIALGRGVQFVLKGDLEGIGTYEENNLVAYDPEEDAVRLFTVNSMGIVHAHAGTFGGGDSFTMTWTGNIRGSPSEEEITVNLISEDEFTIREVDRIGGKVATVGEYVYLRSSRKVLEEAVPAFA